MNNSPLLADFAARLCLGLLSAMLLLSWRSVPLAFFRTQHQIVLGLLVLAALDQARAGGARPMLGLLVAGAVMAYLATLTWGLGLPRFGTALSLGVAATAAAWLFGASWSPDKSAQGAMNAASRLASGLLLGSTLTAMLLGHYYLTAPAMSIDPLKRAIAHLAAALVARTLLAGVAAWASHNGLIGTSGTSSLALSGSLLLARWGLGFVATGVATWLTWKTVQIRSTQSATGILYVATLFVTLGELTSMVLAGRSGLVC
jgi:hypothetical protein